MNDAQPQPTTAGMRIIIRPFLFFLAAPLLAGTADEDWRALTALDTGPGREPATVQEAESLALGHLEKQERALRAFLAAHVADARIFEARLRLVRVLNMRADFTGTPGNGEAALLLAEALEKVETPEQRTEMDFALLAERMRAARGRRPTRDERHALMAEVRRFQKAHPRDRRVPAVLVEVANQFDAEPPVKLSLLMDAKKLTNDDALLAQIADDQRRLSFAGKKLPLRFVALDGKRHTVEDWAGKPVAVLFFATWSAPSLEVFREIEKAAATAGAVFVAISLDPEREPLDKLRRETKTRAIVAWDGNGWKSPLIEALGINAIPAAWLLDADGVLRSLDLLDDPGGLLRKHSR